MEQKDCKICGKLIYDPEDGTKDGYYHRVCYYRKYHKYKTDQSKPWEPPTYHKQVLLKPGEWFSKQQEQDTSRLLRAIGWKKTHKGVWYDDKIRDREGNWLKNTKPKFVFGQRKVWSKEKRWIRENGNIPWIHYGQNKRILTDEQVKQVQEDYYLNNLTIANIANRLKVNKGHIAYIVAKTNQRVKMMIKNEEIGS